VLYFLGIKSVVGLEIILIVMVLLYTSFSNPIKSNEFSYTSIISFKYSYHQCLHIRGSVIYTTKDHFSHKMYNTRPKNKMLSVEKAQMEHNQANEVGWFAKVGSLK